MANRTFVTALVMTFLAAGASLSGPVLDEVLNYMFLDQTTTITPRGELFKVQRTMNLTRDSSIGQTFVTGPDTDRIVRIRTWIRPDADWQRGEGVELVLWDSSEKKVSLGRYTVWYEYRGFQFNRPEFEIDAKVRPGTRCYFEMSYVGEGDGKLSMVGVMNGTDDYRPGQGYLGGKEADFDVCFQTHVKRPMDRVDNLKKAFARFDLERPELAEVKQAVQEQDFDTAQAKLVAYFEARQKPVPVIDREKTPSHNPEFDTTESDLAMHNYFASSEMGRGFAGPNINWRGEPDFSPDGTIAASFWNTGLNRYGPRGPLTRGYIATGSEKYAKKLNDVLLDWYLDNPPPAVSKLGGDGSDPVWATLDAGARLGHGFTAYSALHKSPFFTLDCRMAYILNLADNADTLVLNGEGDGGNWSFTQNGALFQFGLDFSEFKNAEPWFNTACRRIAGSIKKDILPDGVEMESAPGYQRMAYNPLVGVYQSIRERGIRTPLADELKGVMERQADYFMYLAQPDGVAPCLGDWGDNDDRHAIGQDAELFGRSDMLYVSTAGKKGTQPKELSKLYPYAGIVTLRSDWGGAGKMYEDARYLMLHGVHYGAHGHADLNSITAYAYGREFLGDPGSHEYGSPEHELLCKSVSHNLVTVDGSDQDRHAKTAFKAWATTPVADYVSSWSAAYKGGDYNREVFFIRANGDLGAGDYWVVRDTVGGTGVHSLEQRWHFTIDSAAKVDPETLAARTFFEDGGNLSIMQVDPSRLKVQETAIDTWIPRGAKAPARKMPTVIYTNDAALPAAIDTALFPFKGREMPAVQLKTLEKSADGLNSAFKMVQGNIHDLFVLQKSAGNKSLASEKVSFNGERLFVRRVGGKVRSVMLVNGSGVSVGGKQMLKSDKPVSWAVVSFDPTEVRVYVGSGDAKVSVPAARNRKTTVINTNLDALIKQGKVP